MTSPSGPHVPTFAAVLVAAGKGLRAGQRVSKQFAIWRGKPVLRHAADALVAAGITRIVVVIPEGTERIANEVLMGLEHVVSVIGGATRQSSVRIGLEALASDAPDIVLVHDAARPDCPADVVGRLIEALDHFAGAIPTLPVVDSLAIADGELMAGSAAREQLRRVQTPQAFRYAELVAAHRAWSGDPDAGDDAQIAVAAGFRVALVIGDERLRKLTFAEDFMPPSPPPLLNCRTGSGFDVHQLVVGEELWLCGVKIEHECGLAGHSDADVALHAVVDAVLGAAGGGDIGDHFPPSDARWKGAPSSRFVEHAVALAANAGYAIGNVDLTIICEAPKIGPHKDAMRARLAELLSVAIDAVNVKATTTERLGFAGRGEGIAAQAVATLVPLERT